MNKLIVLAFSLSLVACVESETVMDPQDLPVEDQTAELTLATYDESCGIVGESEACALGCNNQLVIETFVPVGQCIAWQCMREDGSPVIVGGCH
jgi:hypothetical protein